ISRRAADERILPSVVTTASDALAPREAARRADRPCSSVRPVLAEANHLGAGNEPRQALRQFHFQRVRQRKTVPLSQLLRHRRIYLFVRVAENIRQKSLDVVDIFIPIHIPNAAPFAFRQKYRSHSAAVL